MIGSRFAGTNISEIPSYRRAGLRVINEATNRIAKQKVSDTQSGFRAYSRKAIQQIRLYERGMGVTSEIDIRGGDAGLAVVEVPVRVAYQGLETSSQNPLVTAWRFYQLFFESQARNIQSLFSEVQDSSR